MFLTGWFKYSSISLREATPKVPMEIFANIETPSFLWIKLNELKNVHNVIQDDMTYLDS